MNVFDSDHNANGDNAEYLELGSGGKIAEIFVTSSTTSIPMRIMGTPGENGMMKFDNRVLDPTRVHVEGWVTEANYAKIADIEKTQKSYELDKALCSYYAKDGISDRLAIVNFTSRSTNDKLNMVFVSLDLQQYQKSAT